MPKATWDMGQVVGRFYTAASAFILVLYTGALCRWLHPEAFGFSVS
jgi:hypothetical protein